MSTPASTSAARSAVGAVGNVLWLVFAGIPLVILYVIAGFLAMVTIVGIPFGIQSFKLAGYALWPFNRMVVVDRRRDAGLSLLGNVAWFLVGGWWLAVAHVLLGLLLVVTIVGAPLGVASFKMAGLALAPFGKKIVPRSVALAPDVVIINSIG